MNTTSEPEIPFRISINGQILTTDSVAIPGPSISRSEPEANPKAPLAVSIHLEGPPETLAALHDALSKLELVLEMKTGSDDPKRQGDRVGRAYAIDGNAIHRIRSWSVDGQTKTHTHQKTTYYYDRGQLAPTSADLLGKVSNVKTYVYDSIGNSPRKDIGSDQLKPDTQDEKPAQQDQPPEDPPTIIG
jgi:hypothetical protein